MTRKFYKGLVIGLLLVAPFWVWVGWALAAAPTLTSATIAANGATWTFVYSEAVEAASTAALCTDYSVTMSIVGAITLSYVSGTGTDTVVCTGNKIVTDNETATAGLDYTPGSIVNGGAESLAAIDDDSVTNDSTITVKFVAAQDQTYTSVVFDCTDTDYNICLLIPSGATGVTFDRVTLVNPYASGLALRADETLGAGSIQNSIIKGGGANLDLYVAVGKTAAGDYNAFPNHASAMDRYTGGGHDVYATDPLFIDESGGDYRIKGSSPYRDAGLISGSVTNDNMRLSIVDGTAFVDFSSSGVFDQYIGGKLVVIDSSGDKLVGYIKAAGSSETYGDELFTDASFEAVTKASAKNVTGITKANPGVVTFASEHGYVNGDIIYFSGLTEMTELNTEYWQLRSNSGDTFELATVYDTTSLDTSGYGSAETTGGACAQKGTFTNWTAAYATWVVGVDGSGALTNKAVNVGSGANQSLYQSITSTEDALHKLITTCDALSAGTYAGYIAGNYLAIDASNTVAAVNWYGTFSSATRNNGITARADLAASFTDISLKKVLTPSATGVTIVSEYGGSTYNWASKDTNFTYNDASDYTYKIYPPLDLRGNRIIDELDIGAYEYQAPVMISIY